MKVVIAHQRLGGGRAGTATLDAQRQGTARRSTRSATPSCPGEEGLPSATDCGVPEAMLMAVGSSPSKAERDGFAGLLDAWDTQLGGSAESPFSSLSQAERERTLLALGGLARRCRCARRLPGAPQGHPAELLLPSAPAARGRTRWTRRSATRARSGRPRTRPARRSGRSRSRPTRSSMRRGASSARAPAAAPPPACSPRPASTWSWSRPAATTARRTSTAPSCPATRGST